MGDAEKDYQRLIDRNAKAEALIADLERSRAAWVEQTDLARTERDYLRSRIERLASARQETATHQPDTMTGIIHKLHAERLILALTADADQ